jgi:hypothetical protein
MESTDEKGTAQNKETINWVGVPFTLKGKKYILKKILEKRTDEVYDYESFFYAKENPGAAATYIGKLKQEGKKVWIEIV